MAFFTQACAVNVVYGHAWAGRIKLPVVAGAGAPALELPGLQVPLEPHDLPTFLTETSDYPAYLNLVLKQFDGLDAADHALINSYELQPQESEYMTSTWRIKTVGPTVPSAYLDKRLPNDRSYGFQLHDPVTTTRS
uniref:Uncharacterized protein n=1 Tax=Oryza brachyantha TaxID=4533 RepID=J3MFP7_ORYBR